jgi:hypothetical protein
LPAEELVELRQGADYGWRECNFDNQQRKLVLGPEYGGDGGKKIGICASRAARRLQHRVPAACRRRSNRRLLPVPKGFTKQQVALGSRVFHGEVADGTCGGCYGSDGKGSPIAPDLTTGKWLWSDGSLQGLETTIKNGVPGAEGPSRRDAPDGRCHPFAGGS